MAFEKPFHFFRMVDQLVVYHCIRALKILGAIFARTLAFHWEIATLLFVAVHQLILCRVSCVYVAAAGMPCSIFLDTSQLDTWSFFGGCVAHSYVLSNFFYIHPGIFAFEIFFALATFQLRNRSAVPSSSCGVCSVCDLLGMNNSRISTNTFETDKCIVFGDCEPRSYAHAILAFGELFFCTNDIRMFFVFLFGDKLPNDTISPPDIQIARCISSWNW